MRQSPVAASKPLLPGMSCRSVISSPATAGAELPTDAVRPSLHCPVHGHALLQHARRCSARAMAVTCHAIENQPHDYAALLLVRMPFLELEP